jgi:hypothetical protein
MRLTALIVAAGLAAAVSVSAKAAPLIPNLDERAASNIITIAGGCGRGLHRNWRGFCVPNRYYGYRPYYSRPYNYRPYRYYGYYGPYYHRPYYRYR